MRLIVQTFDGEEIYEAKEIGDSSSSLDNLSRNEVFSGTLDLMRNGFEIVLDETDEEAASSVKHTVELGSIDGVPEFKTVMERHSWGFASFNRPVLYTRKSKIVLYADVVVPANVNTAIVNHLRKCAIGAIATAGLTAAIASPAAAIPAFQTALYKCLSSASGAVTSNIKVSLYVKQTTDSDWTKA